jgi:ABC-type uncharacterized transport system ATPase subunit
VNVLEMKGITKHFGPVIANDKIDFALQPGEIRALLGENGAGKTTLMRILYGLYRADAGEIWVNGQQVPIHSPKDAIAQGIGMVTQHFALVPPLTVAENVVLGMGDGFALNKAQTEQKVAEAAARFSLDIRPAAVVRQLSVGQMQRVEILKALYRNARILILDEPTAVLIPQEVDMLFETLQRLQAEGLSVVFISHKLEEVLHISGGVTVLRDGKVVGTVNTADTTHRELARMMVGRETFGVCREDGDGIGDPVLRLEGLSALDGRGLLALKKVSLAVHAGEILGIAGVSGNGQKELAETVCGVRTPSGGRILVGDQDVTGADPERLDAAGMGRIPQDRQAGVIGELTVAENAALEHLNEFTKRGIVDRQGVSQYAQGLIDRFQIKASLGDKARTLSGGNLQKLILARVLSREPKVVIAPQPTRGLDVGATEYVRTQLLEQRSRGAAVMLISEDLEEILALSDRIAVMYEGEVVGIVPTCDADEEHLGLMMSGALKEKPNVTVEA